MSRISQHKFNNENHLGKVIEPHTFTEILICALRFNIPSNPN